MANLYNDFINHEMENIIDLKKKNMTIDELYTRVEDKFNDFICKHEHEINYDTFKILLKAQIDSLDHNYIISIPSLSFNATALTIALASFAVSSFSTGEIVEWIYRGYNVWAIIALILLMLTIGCIFSVPIYSSKILKNSRRIFNKKKILNICLEILKNYEIEHGFKKHEVISKNKREFHVVVETK